MTPTDPLYRQQWHFSLIGDIETIWDEFDGTGVQVGVYDDGIQYTHPDLAANYDASRHFTYQGVTYDGIANDPDEVHGTSVAGIIAAQNDNGRGGTGVAHGATLTSVNIFDPALTANLAIERAMIQWAQNFDIMSNSWGWTPEYDAFQNLSLAGSLHAQYQTWYGVNVANGRGGLGTIIVQAAGNDALNANGSGVNGTRFSLTVAATDENGDIQDYSNWGACILVAGPASAVTTDRTGNSGYNAAGDSDPLGVDYTSSFGGTSAATPTVSGVVALMLDANEGLGWRDVADILAMSASLTGSAYGGAGTGFEVGNWQSGGTNSWNGGGSAFHLSYGYGMVNAFAAVRMAEAWLVMHDGVAQTSANELRVTGTMSGGPVNIPDAGGGAANATVVVAGNIEIDTVYVKVQVTHSYASDLQLSLVAPDGTEFGLFLNEGGDSLFDSGLTWTFAVELARGYSSAGTWTVRAVDSFAGDVGTIGAVTLTFFGSKSSANDVYHFTEDFLTLRSVDAGRGVVSDAGTGSDWLNMAGLHGDIQAGLSDGSTVRVDGVQWFTLAAGTRMENIYAGDGNDTLTGSALANEIHGARGNDLLSGLGGADTLVGGQGNDRLIGGTGTDFFEFSGAFGSDRITDFADNVDTLVLDDALWGGGLTVAQVIGTFADTLAAGVRFDFGGGNVILLVGFANAGLLSDDLAFI
ncbi:S8 family serine peptidase [Neotabrizicola shimadae]|uniref:S8 family serine peptidase n=1 Tax=Neotabrizicola shimadae TaxID=2807096 RepID=A0A8G0ZT01_9RHOB|nr:S8 family serine peptidase [Neotabrizicola shimadae]QYZ69904.1 S8 family serine peptidase [Neotabrizicola shimadae]